MTSSKANTEFNKKSSPWIVLVVRNTYTLCVAKLLGDVRVVVDLPKVSLDKNTYPVNS